ncbi:large ribosomal subunit protein bL20-like [Oscarella lobularis]|uniref:large ribosomal subunit protein bL20-like n=1 Tax=Oscarella lobularis TaxID=121494 RepID=UPI003313F41D
MVRGGPSTRSVRRAKVFALAKGFRGRSKNCYSLAVRRVHKALQYQYTSRRLKKRDMRSLWIQRIGAGTMEHGISYSTFMHEMATSDIQLNRKVLSEIAVHEPKSFKALADFAKKRHEDGLRAAL